MLCTGQFTEVCSGMNALKVSLFMRSMSNVRDVEDVIVRKEEDDDANSNINRSVSLTQCHSTPT